MDKYLKQKLDKYEKFLENQSEILGKEIVREVYIDSAFEIFKSSIIPLLTIALGIHALHVDWSHESADAMATGIGGLIMLIGSCVAGDSMLHTLNYLIFAKKCPNLFIARKFRELVAGE